MEQGALVEQLGEVLGLADEVGSWEETVRLLRSLLDWLAFRLEREE
jgi:hypothetical protein